MHTLNLDPSLLDLRLDGRPAPLAALLPGWTEASRLGLVVAEPLGLVGAAGLIAAAVAHFYALRRDRDRAAPVYPEIYAFHVGGPHGDFSYFDFLPPRKEVVLPAGDPLALLESLNDRAITHLAVPDRSPAPHAFPWQEANIAAERIVAAYAYSPGGVAQGADAALTLAPALDELALGVTEPDRLLAEWDPVATLGTPRAPQGDGSTRRDWLESVHRRMAETNPEARAEAARRYEALRQDGRVTQGIRRLATAQAFGALAALSLGAAGPFDPSPTA